MAAASRSSLRRRAYSLSFAHAISSSSSSSFLDASLPLIPPTPPPIKEKDLMEATLFSSHTRSLPSSRRPQPFAYSVKSILQVQHRYISVHSNSLRCSITMANGGSANMSSKAGSDYVDINWESLGFAPVSTDYMYIMKCLQGADFSKGELHRFGNIELCPASAVINYGQGVFEGLKAYRKENGMILLFRPEENARRMRIGAERMCMPSPTIEQFVDAAKLTVLANKRWVPPTGKGSLYIRPLLIGTGNVLSLEPSPEYKFIVYASPVGNYFKGLVPIHLLVENEIHRAAPGGTGCVKSIGNYASVLKAQIEAKAKGFSDVLYIDPIHKTYLEEVSSCNIFVVKGNVISTPATSGTILPGITRKSIIDVGQRLGYEVTERLISVEELVHADEVFCTGTAVVVSPVGSVTHLGKRIEYGEGGVGFVARQLYTTLTNLQMGLTEDNLGWTMEIN